MLAIEADRAGAFDQGFFVFAIQISEGNRNLIRVSGTAFDSGDDQRHVRVNRKVDHPALLPVGIARRDHILGLDGVCDQCRGYRRYHRPQHCR